MVKILLSEIKKQIDKEIKEKFDELEVEKNKFIESASKFCIDWVRGFIERKVFDYDIQVSEKLGFKLKEFKHEVDIFCEKIPDLVKEEFAKKDYWQHYKISDFNNIEPEKFKAPYHFNGINEPKIFDQGIRIIIGQIGPILKKYGYLTPEKDPTDQWEQEQGVFYCPFPLIRYWPKNMIDIAESYAKKLEEFQKINYKLEQIHLKEKEEDIKRKWY